MRCALCNYDLTHDHEFLRLPMGDLRRTAHERCLTFTGYRWPFRVADKRVKA